MRFDGAYLSRWLSGGATLAALEHALWILVGVSLVSDILTTFIGLHLGLVESNPIARGAIYGYGVVGMLLLKGFAVGVGLVCRPLLSQTHRAIVPASLAIPWTIATCSNIYMILNVI